MPEFEPVTLQVIDENGQTIVDVAVPFSFEIDVIQIMEKAFVLSQTGQNPDPFLYTVEYYGYSEAAQYPGYLGYEIESILGKPTNQQLYWALSVNGISSTTGADTTLPSPGSKVTWTYTPIPQNPANLTARTRVVHSRRLERVARLDGAAARS